MYKFDNYIYESFDRLKSIDDTVLNEDTQKTKDGKWVNKGDEGTHGEFKTKKEADAQRKAMFANGFHEELEESYQDKFWQIIKFLKSILDNNEQIANWSYNDYAVEPDWNGGGMRISVQVDTNRDYDVDDVTGRIIDKIGNKFHGVRIIGEYGRDWDYYITIYVDEKACNESLSQDIHQDHENVKDVYGQEVYDATEEYCEEGHDLGELLYSEQGWHDFVDWAREKGIEFNIKG